MSGIEGFGLRNYVEINVPVREGDVMPGMMVKGNPPLITIDLEALDALFELYHGLNEANENGTGYSPRVAQAMGRLKPFFERNEAKLQSSPSDDSPFATP